MTGKKQNSSKKTSRKKSGNESIKKFKDKMKHQNDALKKILKTIQNDENNKT